MAKEYSQMSANDITGVRPGEENGHVVSRGETFKRIIKLLKPNAVFVVLSIILAAVSVAGNLYVPVLSGNGVDMIIGPGNVDFAGIIRICIAFAIATAVAGAAQWVMALVNNRITYRTVRDVRKTAFDKLSVLPIRYLDGHMPGEIISRITTDVEQFSDGLMMGFAQAFTGVLTIVITLVIMLTIEWRIAIAVLVMTPISILVARYIANRTYNMFRLQSITRAEMTGFVEEYVGEARSVRAFGYKERMLKQFDGMNDNLQKVSLKATFASSLSNPSTRFVNSLVYAVVGVLGAYMAIKGQITVGQLVVVLAYAHQYTRPFNDISNVMTEMQNALACAQRVFEFVDEDPETPDVENAVDLGATDAACEGDGGADVDGGDETRGIVFDHMSFGYDDTMVIHDLNLILKPGEHVAIVGKTGCGKTTLINLLMRFYDPTDGEIRIRGVKTTDLSRDSLHDFFGMVLQDTFLRSGTVAENIAYAKPDATREEIVDAAKRARAHGFIKRLPEGYDTVLGEGGGTLSAGQKQLLCIARAILKDAPALILDEATSSIDTRTEFLVQEAFNELMKGRSSLIVAHRLSTIKNADRILVMDAGRIMEQGDHETLLAQGGYYARLYESQFAGQET